jgi:hypothetical protein
MKKGAGVRESHHPTRISAGEGANRFELAWLSYNEVLRAVKHEDNKAYRILTAIAFLTVGAATLFGSVVSRSSGHPRWALPERSVDLTLLSFGLFIALVLLGTLFFLSALGPKFNVPRPWSTKTSRLFFLKIAEYPEAVWMELAIKPEEELCGLYLDDLLYETWLLARKTKYKVVMMATGGSHLPGGNCGIGALSSI